LLTLFVLLLAYQNHDRAPAVPDRSATRVDLVLGLLQPPRPGPSLSPAVAAATGFAMPGEGLLPLVVGAAAREPNDLATADVEPAVSEPPEATPPPAPVTLTATDPAASTSAPAPQPATADDGDTAVVVPGAPVNPAETDVEVAAGTPPAAVLRSAPGESEAAVHPATDELLAVLRHSALGDDVEITARPGAVSLEIRDSILFAPASAALSAAGLALLDQLAGVLRTLPYSLSVEGHSDNVPIHTRQYPSNWELSAARAASVTRALIEQGVTPARVRAIGYGDTRPRSENLSAEGRARNRRVSFVLQVES
jgi:chemotaxis protein MotB